MPYIEKRSIVPLFFFLIVAILGSLFGAFLVDKLFFDGNGPKAWLIGFPVAFACAYLLGPRFLKWINARQISTSSLITSSLWICAIILVTVLLPFYLTRGASWEENKFSYLILDTVLLALLCYLLRKKIIFLN